MSVPIQLDIMDRSDFSSPTDSMTSGSASVRPVDFETSDEASTNTMSSSSQNSSHTAKSFEIFEKVSSKGQVFTFTASDDQVAIERKSQDGKFNVAHKDDTKGKGNQSHDVPVDESCNMWILPTTKRFVSVPEVLDHIRGYGRIWSIEKGPGAERSSGWTISFFELSAARRFLHDARSNHQDLQGFSTARDNFQVYPSSRHQRNHSDVKGSRCLIIRGADDRVDPESLVAHWIRHCRYFEYLTIRCRPIARQRHKIEVLFAQFRKQVRHGCDTLERCPLKGVESFEYGRDPCAYPDSVKSSFSDSERDDDDEDGFEDSDGDGAYSVYSCPSLTDDESDS